jgi:hypothetical protein
MREWSLRSGDPLALTLAADARLGAPDYVNDHIWELDLGTGEPAALSLRTTYGLRARAVRLFPRFIEAGKAISDPAEFAAPPRVTRIYPNFIALAFSPLSGVDVTAEYWVPSSQVITGRLVITNRAVIPHPLKLELCGQLVPLNGQSFSPVQMQSVTVLEGRTENLAPVVFMTGGPQPGAGPYPALHIGLDLAPGTSRTLTWVQAALGDHKSSFDLARRIAARPWDAERARIELVNDSQMVDIVTGDADWDAALALSQKAAFGLLFPPSASGSPEHVEGLPHPSFVLSRQPDQGYSRRDDGSDYSHFWSGQPPLETLYLASLLPGAPALARGFFLNFLSTQTPEGEIDCRPGLAGQRGKFLAPPLLATLAWRIYESTADRAFLSEAYPALMNFFRAWLSPEHDRDGNSLPEWSHVLQTGFEENPLFDPWHTWAQGAEITAIQSPTLASMLYREARTLARIAEELEIETDRMFLKTRAGEMRTGIEACWDEERSFYGYADRDTHLRQAGRMLSQRRAEPTFSIQKKLPQPARLLIRIHAGDGTSPRPAMTIRGALDGGDQSEHLDRADFTWSGAGAVATSRRVYTSVGEFELEGVPRKAQVTIQTLDLTFEDHTLFLPLWAGIPPAEAELMVARAVQGRVLRQALWRARHAHGACPGGGSTRDQRPPALEPAHRRGAAGLWIPPTGCSVADAADECRHPEPEAGAGLSPALPRRDGGGTRRDQCPARAGPGGAVPPDAGRGDPLRAPRAAERLEPVRLAGYGKIQAPPRAGSKRRRSFSPAEGPSPGRTPPMRTCSRNRHRTSRGACPEPSP